MLKLKQRGQRGGKPHLKLSSPAWCWQLKHFICACIFGFFWMDVFLLTREGRINPPLTCYSSPLGSFQFFSLITSSTCSLKGQARHIFAGTLIFLQHILLTWSTNFSLSTFIAMVPKIHLLYNLILSFFKNMSAALRSLIEPAFFRLL